MSSIPPNREPASAPYSAIPPNRETATAPYPLTPPNREEPQSTVSYSSPPNREVVDTLVAMQQQTDTLERKVENIETGGGGSWVWLQTPATSTSWDGDARSTTGKTLIDLSVVFSVPDYVKAVLVRAIVQDSGAGAADCQILLSPNATAGSGIAWRCPPSNDRWTDGTYWVPCDANGDIYYQTVASGTGTLDVHLQIWGYQV